MIVRLLLLSASLFFGSCYYKSYYSPSINIENFSEILVGDGTVLLKNTLGAPYEVKKLDDGTEQWHYIERIEMHGDRTDQRHYYFIVKDNKIIDKSFTDEYGHFKIYSN